MRLRITPQSLPNIKLRLDNLPNDKEWVIEIKEYDSRSEMQNSKMHALLGDIAKQSTHLNQVLSLDDWKRLCVAQFRKDSIESDIPRVADYWKKNEFKIIPSLDGSSLVTLGSQTRLFPQYVASAFIEWLIKFGAENNIKYTDSFHNPEQF